MTTRWQWLDGSRPEFLPRLEPAAFGQLPIGRFWGRWYGVVDGLDVVVSSQRPADGESQHLIADMYGNWLAYRHNMQTKRRQRMGSSAERWPRLARLWGVHP